MTETDPCRPNATWRTRRADAVTSCLRAAWPLLLTAAGLAGVAAGWLPSLEPWSIGLAMARVPLVMLWVCRVMV